MNGGQEFHSPSRSGHLERTSLDLCYSSPPPERGNNRGRNGSSNFVPTSKENTSWTAKRRVWRISRFRDLSDDYTILKICTYKYTHDFVSIQKNCTNSLLYSYSNKTRFTFNLWIIIFLLRDSSIPNSPNIFPP